MVVLRVAMRKIPHIGEAAGGQASCNQARVPHMKCRARQLLAGFGGSLGGVAVVGAGVSGGIEGNCGAAALDESEAVGLGSGAVDAGAEASAGCVVQPPVVLGTLILNCDSTWATDGSLS